MKIGQYGVWRRLLAHLSYDKILNFFEDQDSTDSTVEILNSSEKELKKSLDFDTFVIRERGGEKFLSFWRENSVFHWPISYDLEGNFKLLESKGFPTLSELITFYQLNALPIPEATENYCKLLPEKPLSRKDFFQLQEWYAPHLTEQDAIQ